MFYVNSLISSSLHLRGEGCQDQQTFANKATGAARPGPGLQWGEAQVRGTEIKKRGAHSQGRAIALRGEPLLFCIPGTSPASNLGEVTYPELPCSS